MKRRCEIVPGVIMHWPTPRQSWPARRVRAADTTLDRDVAVTVLPEAVTADLIHQILIV